VKFVFIVRVVTYMVKKIIICATIQQGLGNGVSSITILAWHIVLRIYLFKIPKIDKKRSIYKGYSGMRGHAGQTKATYT